MMTTRLPHRLSIVVLIAAVGACAGTGTTSTPTSPAPPAPASTSPTGPSTPATTTVLPPAPPGPCTIGFDEFTSNGAVSSLVSCSLSIAASGAAWQALMTYGKPAPFVQFISNGGMTSTGDITVSGGTFTFTSVDIYSSTTKIPYEITGLAGATTVFQLQDVQGNTFGNFATIVNPKGGTSIDTLRIHLTNPAAPCCTNPVGLDNIRIVR